MGVTRTGVWWGNHSENEQLKMIKKTNLPERGKTFFCTSECPDGVCRLLFSQTCGTVPAVKRPEREVDHLSPSTAEVKN